MKITFENKNIKCDSISCNKMADVKLDINSFKGYLFLCKGCYRQIQSLLKRNIQKDEQE